MPPVTAPRVNVPLFSPQLALPGVVTIAVGPVVLLMAAVVEKIQPLASFTSMVCDPAAKLV